MGILNNILAAIDTSVMAEEVLKRAILLAKKENAQITVLHSIDIPLFDKPFGNVDDEEKIKNKIVQKMDALNAEAKVDYFVTVTRGNPSDKIVYEADRLQSDLIIIGAHGRERIKDTFFGSTAHNVTQKSHLPVLIVKTPAVHEYRNILALTDLSEASEKNIRFAQELFEDATINVSYAYQQMSELSINFYNLENERELYREELRKQVEEDVEAFQKSLSLDNTEVIEGFDPVGEMLLETAKKQKCDLVLLGAHGIRVSDTVLYGSTASFLMKAVPSDVLIYVPLEE